jgi:hypothetical protein
MQRDIPQAPQFAQPRPKGGPDDRHRHQDGRIRPVPGLTPLDLIGPLQVLNRLGADPRFRVTVVGDRVEPMSCDIPVKLLPEKTFDQVPNPYLVLVPGDGLARSEPWATRPSAGADWNRQLVLLEQYRVAPSAFADSAPHS